MIRNFGCVVDIRLVQKLLCQMLAWMKFQFIFDILTRSPGRKKKTIEKARKARGHT